MSWWLAGGLLVGLVLVHMARPRFERRFLSAARFFTNLPPAKQGSPRLRLASPVRSRPLLLHLPLLLLVCAALFLKDHKLAADPETGFGVWLLVDTSGSMMTQEAGQSRQLLAQAETEKVLSQIQDQSGDRDVCIRLSSFDQELVDLVQSTDITQIRSALSQLQARPLGTDLKLLRGLILAHTQNEQTDCAITHLVVISDMPAPDWVALNPQLDVVWRHVGKPVPNVGITHVDALRDQLTGLVRRVRITVTAYGEAFKDVRLQVTDPQGKIQLDQDIAWAEHGTWRFDFVPTHAGRYQLSLSPGGAWPLDDQCIVEIDDERAVRVDWHLADKRLLRQLAWQENPARPHLRVLALPPEANPVPTLFVGDVYGKARTEQNEIRDFMETSPLLADLNLDVVETLKLPGLDLPEGFEPVLRTMDGKILLAQSEEPLAAIVPGLPTGTADNLGHFTATVFFNAVKYLMAEREPSPLYQLTSPAAPTVEGNRLAIHPGEGNTARQSVSHGHLDRLQPVTLAREGKPIWPQLLALAVLIYLIERTLAAYGGDSWR